MRNGSTGTHPVLTFGIGSQTPKAAASVESYRWKLNSPFKPPPANPMKRIHPRFHGPLAALGFLLIMALVALIESIGGSL